MNNGLSETILLRAVVICVSAYCMTYPSNARSEPATTDVAATTRSATSHAAEGFGRQIYEQGVLPSGERIEGVLLGDISLVGNQLYCTSCHGRSGLGSAEGPIITPAISGVHLYETHEINRKELYASRLIRPAYTNETLKRAIREGIDANGDLMHEMMPRYSLGDKAADYLVEYLKTLSSEASPGVTNDTIYFASVVTDGVDDRKREAILSVLDAFFASKNATTRQETRRAELAPIHKEWRYRAYRKWSLHEWRLSGDSASWSAQLEKYYASQPVFAMISGVGTGSWKPIHEFCEAKSLPCILPNTRLPVINESDWYSVYFSKGVTLEAAAIARHVQGSAANTGKVIQVLPAEQASRTAASALRSEFAAANLPPPVDRVIASDEDLSAEFWQTLVDVGTPYTLVLWNGIDEPIDFVQLAELENAPERIYLASAASKLDRSTIPDELRALIFLTYPYDLPSDSAGRLKRVNFWMKQKGIRVTDEQLQSNALFTAMLVSQALKHIGNNFYRDYFVEKIEHIMDSMATLASYPNLSLASSQRFASKGCYIAALSDGNEDNIVLTGEWIVP